jgi:transcriptional regulator with XRE-family HTH domain
MPSMAESHRSRGKRRGETLYRMIGVEIRTARTAAGLTLREVGDAVDLSAGELSRIERGLAPWLTISMASTICAVVGLDLWARCYAAGDPIRDAGQVKVEQRIRAIVHKSLPIRAEVPLPLARDPRAWDLVIGEPPAAVAVEVETRVTDVQALLRRLSIKRRDGGVGHLILAIDDRRANRSVMRGVRELIRADYPLDGQAIERDLRAGRVPPTGGIWFVGATDVAPDAQRMRS